jgi:hypothetical protein
MVHEAMRAEVAALQQLLVSIKATSSHSFSVYAQRMQALNENVLVHAKQEDGVIMPLLARYFPGLEVRL